MRLAMAGALAFAFIAVGAAFAEPVKTKVAEGVVVGDRTEGISTYKGMPYAAPPVGDLRWKPPQPAVKWSGERDATEFGASCTQTARLGREARISEDCLYLNVWAPANARKAPVMVWIHGGSNTNGSGAIYNGAAFARDGVVTVTINYRMGPFGFFAHPALTAAAGPNEPLANYGLMDQTAALRWVQANIASFGGDPKKVTVFGESAGAIDIYALLGLKSSKGLFSKAILESNITWGDSAPLAKAEEDGVALALRTGAPEGAALADLRAIPADKLLAAQNGALFPIVDGRFMTESSISAVANKHIVDVPMIIGTNSFEASLVARNTEGQALTDWTNAQAGAPARYIAAKASDGKPVWLYFFSYVATDRRDGSPGAAHASEIPYVYGGMTRPPVPGTPPAVQSDEDKAMANLMHGCWVAFAKTGTAKCPSGDIWPKYSIQGDKLMEFGSPSGVRTNFRKAELDAAQAAEPAAK
jgi:para-nitrobenzyl esterase